ncbi:unnamed protein product [Ectocarpus sp. 12 AP-2014]
MPDYKLLPSGGAARNQETKRDISTFSAQVQKKVVAIQMHQCATNAIPFNLTPTNQLEKFSIVPKSMPMTVVLQCCCRNAAPATSLHLFTKERLHSINFMMCFP